MKNFLLGLFLGVYMSFAFAGNILPPPPLDSEPAVEQHYFDEIYRNWHRLEVVTTNPDGARNGKKGDMLHLQTGGNYYHCENVDSLTTWRCSQLTDIP